MVSIIKKFDIPKEISIEIKDNFVIFSNIDTKVVIIIPKPFKADFSEDTALLLSCTTLKLGLKKRSIRQLSLMGGSLKAKIAQTISGISSGFSKELELVGVGYKAELLNLDKLVLKLGYSHDILLDIPEKLTVACPKDNILILKSYCKESLGSFVSLLKKSKTLDIYKNKGVLFKGEPLITKKFKKK